MSICRNEPDCRSVQLSWCHERGAPEPGRAERPVELKLPPGTVVVISVEHRTERREEMADLLPFRLARARTDRPPVTHCRTSVEPEPTEAEDHILRGEN